MSFDPGPDFRTRNTSTSPISVLFLGTAKDGPLDEAYWFPDSSAVSSLYGGTAVARFTPGPTDTGLVLASDFVPDYLTLQTLPDVYLYHVDPTDNTPRQYTSLYTWTGTGNPTALSFDPIGYDASTTIYPGGLVLESPGIASGDSAGDLLVPLCSALTELTFQGTTGAKIGGCRVGSAWLSNTPPTTTVTFQVGDTTAQVVFLLSGQGTGTAFDRYLTPTVTVGPTTLLLDPGTLGLPNRLCTYLYTDYLTWDALWSQVQTDGLNDMHPFRITSRPTPSSAAAQTSPGTGYTEDAEPTTTYPTYTNPGFPEPDVTQAATWAEIFEKEDLPLDAVSFVSPCGLSGQALAADTNSTIRLLQALEIAAQYADDTPDLTLVVPWSLTPPPPDAPYSATGDSLALATLLTTIGPTLAGRLMVFWGTCTQGILPDNRDGSQRVIPAAPAILGALVRESTRLGNSNNTQSLLLPPVYSASSSGIPPVVVDYAGAPPTPVRPTGVPGPTDLAELQAAGMNALYLGFGGVFRVYGPLALADGTPFRRVLVQAALRADCHAELEQYLGQINNDTTRTALTQSLAQLQAQATQGQDAIARQIASYSLTLLYDPTTGVSVWDEILVQGRLVLFGEVVILLFQLSVTGS